MCINVQKWNRIVTNIVTYENCLVTLYCLCAWIYIIHELPYMAKHLRGKLLRFSRFLLNHECFMSNSLLTIGIYYQKLLPRKFSHDHPFSILTVKVFPLACFAVYSNDSAIDETCPLYFC